MSGTYKHLAPGRYQLEVETGVGPAGIRRPDGRDVVVGVDGGSRSFRLDQSERVYYWWRGPERRPGIQLRAEKERQEREQREEREQRSSTRRSVSLVAR